MAPETLMPVLAVILALALAVAAVVFLVRRRHQQALAVQAAKERCIETYEPFLAALAELRATEFAHSPVLAGDDSGFALPWWLSEGAQHVDDHRNALIMLHRTMNSWGPADPLVQMMVMETTTTKPAADDLAAAMNRLRDRVWPAGTTFEDDLARHRRIAGAEDRHRLRTAQ